LVHARIKPTAERAGAILSSEDHGRILPSTVSSTVGVCNEYASFRFEACITGGLDGQSSSLLGRSRLERGCEFERVESFPSIWLAVGPVRTCNEACHICNQTGMFQVDCVHCIQTYLVGVSKGSRSHGTFDRLLEQ
jgi:hypothetical protein